MYDNHIPSGATNTTRAMLRVHSTSPTVASRRGLDTATTTPSEDTIVETNADSAKSTKGQFLQEEERPAASGGPPLTPGASGNLGLESAAQEIFFCVFLGILFCLCYKCRRFWWCSSDRRPRGGNRRQQEASSTSPPTSNQIPSEEKAARKIFVEENLPAKKWMGRTDNDDCSLEAPVGHGSSATGHENKTTEDTVLHQAAADGKDDEDTAESTTIQDATDCASDTDGGDDDCPICLTPFQRGDLVSCSTGPMGSCQHIFHRECVYAWLLDHRDCPMCRHTFLKLSSSSSLREEEQEGGKLYRNNNMDDLR